MTSPVDTSVKYFHSAMPGAPVLNGTAGSVIAILDACLVNGFGLKTADSLVVTNSVATLNIASGHSAEVDAVVLVSGATPAALNGEQKVTATTGTTISFATSGLANQTATGTITVKLAPANWSKAFSGTNLAGYKSTDVAATGCLLRVDDTGTRTCRVLGYETMSDINTGTGMFPTTVQHSGGGYWSKSYTADATARAWMLVSDGRLFYFGREYYNTSYAGGYELTAFGDIASTKAGDVYGCMLSGIPSDYSGGQPSSSDNLMACYGNAAELYLPRSYTAVGGSCQMRKNFAMLSPNSSAWSGYVGAAPSYPNPCDGGLYLAPLLLIEDGSKAFRGTATGFYCCSQYVASRQFSARDTMKGVTSLSGRTLKVITSYADGCGTSPAFFDITGPWSR